MKIRFCMDNWSINPIDLDDLVIHKCKNKEIEAAQYIKKLKDTARFGPHAEAICSEWGEPGHNMSDENEKRVGHWELYAHGIEVNLVLSPRDKFINAIRDVCSNPVLRGGVFQFTKGEIENSYIARKYEPVDGTACKFTIRFYPSKIVNAVCREVKVHDYGPETKIVCDDNAIAVQDEVKDIIIKEIPLPQIPEVLPSLKMIPVKTGEFEICGKPPLLIGVDMASGEDETAVVVRDDDGNIKDIRTSNDEKGLYFEDLYSETASLEDPGGKDEPTAQEDEPPEDPPYDDDRAI